MEKDIKTEQVQYPCPICGLYFIPEYHQKNGIAVMKCKEHGLFKTSVAVSLNFRKFCSKIARKPNRSPVYYTSSERKLRDILNGLGMIEALSFFHNSRIGFTNMNKRKTYYWLDFVIPSSKLVVEINPSIWHKFWKREDSDQRKKELIEKLGWKYIGLNEKEIDKLTKENILDILNKINL